MAEMERPILSCAENMRQALALAQRVADSDTTVLIQGESGTGKELFARFIHQHSRRGRRAFVAMNCAALPENLAESELFGYEKGAFTGANQLRPGKFELADQGTLLLDEIGEMQLPLQAKLLRVLQEKEVDHIGGNAPVPVDVRVIATTNRDLQQMVQEARFRQDLYYRLRVIPIQIPPLRNRKEDIPLLVDFFIRKFCPAHRSPLPRFSSQSLLQMERWDWPGNVRELENMVERALLLCDDAVIGHDFLMLELQNGAAAPEDKNTLVGMTVKEMEKRLIGQTLKHVYENRTYAAKMLGISIRTLRNKLKEYHDLQDAADDDGNGQG